MRNGDGCAFVIIAVTIAVSAGLMAYGKGMKYGLKEGVCEERWRYQRTVADTLATVRSGCALPPKARQGVGA